MNDFLTELSELNLNIDISEYGATLDDFKRLCYWEGIYEIENCDELFADLREVEEYFEEVYGEECVDARTDNRVYKVNVVLDESDNRFRTNDEEFEKLTELISLACIYQDEEYFSEYADIPLKDAKTKARYSLLNIQLEERIELMVKEGKLTRNENPSKTKI